MGNSRALLLTVEHIDQERTILKNMLGGLRAANVDTICDMACETAARIMGTYIVWCKVWGGVTGEREGPLKLNGKVEYFETRKIAQAEADWCQAHAEKNIYRTAEYSYTVREA